MVQIPLFPDLALTSEKPVEWAFVGQDVHGRMVFVNYNDPDQFLVDDVLFDRHLGL